MLNPYKALTLTTSNQMKCKTFRIFSFCIAVTDFIKLSLSL